jgi:hypothetical protein
MSVLLVEETGVLGENHPIPVLYGHSSVNTTNPNITGVQCYTEDKFKKTKYQAHFNQVRIMIVKEYWPFFM